MHGVHLITVTNRSTYERFISEGYLGVAPQRGKHHKRWVSTVDTLADLHRVRAGDWIFIMVKGEKIYGVFRATTPFKQDPNTPSEYKTENLRYYPPEPCWQNLSENEFSEPDYFYQVAIESIPEYNFELGIDYRDIFQLKNLGKIWTVPERFKYPETTKTVKPLTPKEAMALIEVFRRENPRGLKEEEVIPKNLSDFDPISIPLDFHDNEAQHEKILEAWVLQQLGSFSNNDVKRLLGSFDYYANAVPSFYLDTMDIYGYLEKDGIEYMHKVIELKKGMVTGAVGQTKCPLSQLLRYRNWVIENRAGGDPRKVEVSIIARDFEKPEETSHITYIEFVELLNRTEYGQPIKLISYDFDPDNYTYTLKQIV